VIVPLRENAAEKTEGIRFAAASRQDCRRSSPFPPPAGPFPQRISGITH
jgi:hypothetical protein